MTAEQWTRVNQIHELVKQEGDSQCEAAFDDLLSYIKELKEKIDKFHNNHHDAVMACVAELQADWDAMLEANITERDEANKRCKELEEMLAKK